MIMVGWVGLNTVWLAFGQFDAYPFILFNLFLTVISTLQGPIIMMAQNREAERDREYVRSLHLKLDLVLRKLEDV